MKSSFYHVNSSYVNQMILLISVSVEHNSSSGLRKVWVLLSLEMWNIEVYLMLWQRFSQNLHVMFELMQIHVIPNGNFKWAAFFNEMPFGFIAVRLHSTPDTSCRPIQIPPPANLIIVHGEYVAIASSASLTGIRFLPQLPRQLKQSGGSIIATCATELSSVVGLITAWPPCPSLIRHVCPVDA